MSSEFGLFQFEGSPLFIDNAWQTVLFSMKVVLAGWGLWNMGNR